MKEITLNEINRLLHIDGTTVKAWDVLDRVPKETLITTLAFIIAKLKDEITQTSLQSKGDGI